MNIHANHPRHRQEDHHSPVELHRQAGSHSRVKCAAIEEQTRKISECADTAAKYGKILESIAESADGQKSILITLSDTLDKHFSPNEENIIEEETV